MNGQNPAMPMPIRAEPKLIRVERPADRPDGAELSDVDGLDLSMLRPFLAVARPPRRRRAKPQYAVGRPASTGEVAQ